MRVLLKFHARLLAGLLLGLAGAASLRAAEAPMPARDVLVYPDGDRVQGRLVERTGDTLVFQSDRFGLLRVPAAGARIFPAGKPAEIAAAPAVVGAAKAPADAPAGGESPAVRESEESIADHKVTASLARLAAKLHAGFKPWTGRFAFSSDMVTDTSDRNTISAEITMRRKWKANEVELKGRYDFSQTNERTTTDMVKLDGLWRHDFRGKGFMLYRPALEWSRASYRLGVPSDYVLVQQEIGAGLNLLATDKAKVRTGLSENMFDVWSIIPGGGHSSRTSESAFVENEFKLPWSLLVVQRGIYYYSIASQDDGWENRVELTKKFTKTLSTAIRHELRRGSPDGKAVDYTRLRLLFGLDF